MADRPELNKAKSESTEIGSAGDFGLSFLDSALARPYNATIGLIAPKIDLSSSYNHNSIAAKVGDFGGSVADILALSKVTGVAVDKGLGWGAERGFLSASLRESPMLASTLSLGSTGALYGGVFTPGSASERLKNASVDFATFGTLGAANVGLNRFGFLGQAGARTFWQDVAAGGLSGIPAGIVNDQASSLVTNHRFDTDMGNVARSGLYYGAFGALMGGAGHGLAEGGARAQAWFARAGEPATVTARMSATPTAEGGEGLAGVSAAPPTSPVFEIPRTGNIELGRMMRETPPADQAALVQQVIASRPQVPIGSWMRLIAPEDMAQFLRATDSMYPETALNNAQYLVETRNLRPATADSPPIDFEAWQRALDTVRAEKAAPAPPPSETDPRERMFAPAEKPFTYDDVTMSVDNEPLLRQCIANNGDSAMGSNILNFANRWATIMEQRMAAGEPLSLRLVREAEFATGMDVQNYELNAARNVLIDTWKHGMDFERAYPETELPDSKLGRAFASNALTEEQTAQVNMYGQAIQHVSSSRSEAISRVQSMDPEAVDPAVRQAILDHLQESQAFLRATGVDAAESIPSVVQAMRNVPAEDIPRFVHYADQFRHESYPNSVMAAMGRAAASGEVAPGTQQAWFDALTDKMRIVFPGVRPSEWPFPESH